MYIASQKKKENIAEYMLYMWQVEDIIRANDLDIEKLKTHIIDKFKLDAEKTKELTVWYENLIEMMRMEDVQKSGHLQINKNIIIDLTDFHKQILFTQQFPDYNSVYYKALPFIAELKSKQTSEEIGDVELVLSFLYGILMLKLQQKEISGGTQSALEVLSKFIVQVSSKYKQYKEGVISIDMD